MKTAPKFHLYVLGDGPLSGLAATGLETEQLTDPGQIEQPALVLLAPGQNAPEQLAPIAIEVPADASVAAVRELVRIAMENVALKQQMTQLEAEAHRRHRQRRKLAGERDRFDQGGHGGISSTDGGLPLECSPV